MKLKCPWENKKFHIRESLSRLRSMTPGERAELLRKYSRIRG